MRRIETLERMRGPGPDALPAVVWLDIPGEWTKADIYAEVHRLVPTAPQGWVPPFILPPKLDEAEWVARVHEYEARRHEHP